ncbi:DUF6692 family protein [Falsiroseomonas sp.]|uniref:DUF6692 family protein n=1 Tax=Falsiroseomonas sp. TaxID=2870721 RepID=UPI002727D413|nr:DUF6692 family protein [Falsiroseomonas sp.]MDO9501411.1 hypothetical protein [Falsiroseomonas sp.]
MIGRNLSFAASLPFVVVLALLAGCDGSDAPDDLVRHARAEEITRITPAAEALANAVVATLDPSTLNDAEIRAVIGTGPRCEFRYTSAGRPVLAVAAQPEGQPLGGVVKLNGHLVRLEAEPASGATATPERLLLTASPVRMSIMPFVAAEGSTAGRREADLVFEVGEALRIGYGGYLSCR